MKKQKSIGNKGFSLVELIIVIAIMAILIGVMAPQLMKYVERSRVSADVQVLDTVRTALMTAALDPAVDSATLPGKVTEQPITGITKNDTNANHYNNYVLEILGDTTENVNKQLKSKGYKGGSILYTMDGNNVTVLVKPVSGSGVTENLQVPEKAE